MRRVAGRRWWPSVVSAGLALAVLAFAPAPARAQAPGGGGGDAQSFAEAKRRFQLGVQLYEQQNFPGALAEFEASYKLRPNPGLFYNIGLAQKALHRYAEAIASFERYLKEVTRFPPGRVELVKRLIAEMKPLLTVLVVSGAPPGAEIRLNGRPVGKAPLEPLLLQAGTYVVEARAEGYLPAQREVTLRVGKAASVELRMVARPTRGQVRIVAVPSSASIKVDGQLKGYGAVELALTPGGHQVVVAAQGHDTRTVELTVAAGQQREVTYALVQRRPFYKTWWFWTAVGSAVVGGTLAGVLTRGSELPYEGSLPPHVQSIAGGLRR